MSKVKLIDLPSYADDRGVFVPVWNNWEVDGHYVDGTPPNHPRNTCAGVDLRDVRRAYFIQNSQKGVVRGFHHHLKETKYFVVLQGVAKFVTIPVEFDSKEDPTPYVPMGEEFGTFIMSDRKQQMLVIPPEQCNGWVSLTNNCLLLALSSSTFEQSKNDDRRIDPYYWGDVWKVKAR